MEKYNENEMVDEIGRNSFFRIMKENGVNFDEVKQKQKSSNEQFHKFNFLIRKLKKENRISFIDVFNYLNEMVCEYNESLDCFDEASKYYLRREMGEKYFIKMKSNKMKKFIRKKKRKS